MTPDYSSGLPVSREAVATADPGVPFWTENLLFCPYDPVCDIGAWLHLGSMPNDFGLWEDRVLICLPGDQGVLSMWAYYRTAQHNKPAGANLAARCIEPFRRWQVTFDGYAQHISNIDMQAGLAPDGPRKRVVMDLTIEAAMPVWDAHTSATGDTGKGGMDTQSWAKEHYEQMYRATGVVRVDGVEYPYNGTGWRDHSTGPRGGSGGDPWGGHVIAGCLFPSGRALIFSRYWKPDGTINLEGGCVYEPDGGFHHCEVVAAPRLTGLQWTGEELPIGLRWPEIGRAHV